jgi:hypothetical protein
MGLSACLTWTPSLVTRHDDFCVITSFIYLNSDQKITRSNYQKLTDLKNLPYFSISSVPRHAPCAAVHPWINSCTIVPFDRFLAVFQWMLPIYGALHFIPTVLFKWRDFRTIPKKMLIKGALGTSRSSAFLAVFVVIYQCGLSIVIVFPERLTNSWFPAAFCFKHYLHDVFSSPDAIVRLPQAIVDSLISKTSFWFLGLLAGLSLFVEEKRRREELAMYVLPKALESAWVMARGKGLVFKTGQYGDIIVSECIQ